MLTKLEYLKEAVKLVAPLERKDWYIYAFALPVFKDNPNWKETLQHRYELITQNDGLYYLDYNEEGKILSKIVDHNKDEPLFNPQTKIEVDSSWLNSIDGKIETKIGTLIINTVAFHSVVGKRLPYINKERPSIGEIESMISVRTKNTADMTDNDISVEHIPSGIDSVSLIISDEELRNKLDKVIEEIRTKLNPDSVEVYPNMALMAVVGKGMIRTRGISARLFTALKEQQINVRMISQGSSEINIIIGIENEDFESAVNAVYYAFEQANI